MFTNNDLTQLDKLGISIEQVNKQLQNFRTGFPYINLLAPATVDNKGIISMDEESLRKNITFYETECFSKKILKFVPASGAATRMFKDLFEFSASYIGAFQKMHKDFPEATIFINSLEKFAFYEDLASCMKQKGLHIKDYMSSHNYSTVVNFVLMSEGLDYGNLPKALIKFHQYNKYSRTSFEEHLAEAAHYALSKQSKAFVHFTVSEEHKELFIQKWNEVKDFYQELFGVEYDISFSVQKQSTDTIAATLENELFRDANGNLVFRPAGHGALIENLNDCDADIIFIKNIDNVVPERLASTTYEYKKACAGLLLDLQSKSFRYLELLKEGSTDFIIIEDFFKNEIMQVLPLEYATFSPEKKRIYLIERLDKPMRVCGMVKNQGEPGGGPFWIKDLNENINLQIVESSQINHSDSGQEIIFTNSTHFNPVDLVCATKNHKGEKFDLKQYVNPETGFISQKSKDGLPLKAQELPGLWNGAMDKWITLFVEVPLITFNPVKTVNDLLRPEHQPSQNK